MNFDYAMKEDQLIAYCRDCRKVSIFEINHDQDPSYVDGERLKECIKCGRYEEREVSE